MRGRIEGRKVYENRALVETGKSNSDVSSARRFQFARDGFAHWRDAGAVVSTAGGTARHALDRRTIYPFMSFALFEFQIGTRLERLVWSAMRIVEALCTSLVMFATAWLVTAGAQTQNFFPSPAIQRFNEQIASYMSIRNSVQEHVGVPYASADSNDIATMQAALANGIRKARPNAKPGEFFSAGVRFEFRRRIQHALESRNVSGFGLMTDLERDAPERFCTLTVNGKFDWRFGAMMPAALIEALPDLPWPLQYRFACRNLVLLDVDASLIVDVLPDALAPQ
jgi:hypothetical protein